jgi:hypothetical protein
MSSRPSCTCMAVGTPGSGTVAIKEDQSKCERGKHSKAQDGELECAEDEVGVVEPATGCGTFVTAATT